MLEHTPVAHDARDGNAADRVEPGPLLRRMRQMLPVGVEIAEAEPGQAPAQPLAHGAPHPPVAGPAQAHPRQAPLQEADAVLVAHCRPLHHLQRRGQQPGTQAALSTARSTAPRIETTSRVSPRQSNSSMAPVSTIASRRRSWTAASAPEYFHREVWPTAKRRHRGSLWA